MTHRGPWHGVRAAGLLVLLLFSQVEAAGATLSIVWRVSGVSWDSPGSQRLDELATGSVPCVSPSDEALGSAQLAGAACARLTRRPEGRLLEPVALSSGITRSPPSSR